jgi:hypothetical protein
VEKGHEQLVCELELKDDALITRLISKLEYDDNPLRYVNHLCLLLKGSLNSHSRCAISNLGGLSCPVVSDDECTEG